MWMQITARAILVFGLTGSMAALGILYIASYGPHLVLSFFGGAAADRFDRRSLVIAGIASQAAVALALGVLAQTGTATLTNLVVLSAVAAACSTVLNPAASALVPSLVPRDDLASAISLQSAANSANMVVSAYILPS